MSVKIINEERERSKTELQMMQIAKKYGYKMSYAYRIGSKANISIMPLAKLAPEIYYDYRKDEYKIQTTSYGSLSLDKYSEYLKYCNNAYNMCRELSDIDISTLDEG